MLKKRRSKLLRLLLGIPILLLLLVGALFIYASDYYRADFEVPATELRIVDGKDALIVDPGGARTALIFYPGGKVEHRSYAPLMVRLAEQGILCIIPRMPANLAVFGINKADAYGALYPEIESWYIGGHSLGGSMAASYAAKHPQQLKGLVLLASYSTSDLSSLPVRVLSIRTRDDLVLDRKAYQKYEKNLPAGHSTIVIEGGNHAGFGSYGFQKGDGVATITASEQQELTAEAIAAFCL